MKMYIFICARVQRKYKLTFSNVKTLFALLVTHKEKRQSRMSVNLKKIEFVPAGVQAGSSSRTFYLEATGAGGKIQSKKLYWLKCKLLHSHYVFFKCKEIQFYLTENPSCEAVEINLYFGNKKSKNTCQGFF